VQAACLRAAAAWVAWGVWTSKSDIQSSTIRLGSDAEPLLISWQSAGVQHWRTVLRERVEACAADKCQAAEFEGTPPGIILRSLHSRKQR
jgi:hypothetical protein